MPMHLSTVQRLSAFVMLNRISMVKHTRTHTHTHCSSLKDFSLLLLITPRSPTVCPTQASLWFTVEWRTWRCWKPPSLVLKVSSETASLLCEKPRTGVSAPLSTLGGATTRFRTSTLMLPGNNLLENIFSCVYSRWIVLLYPSERGLKHEIQEKSAVSGEWDIYQKS